jgi:hypothetical protein
VDIFAERGTPAVAVAAATVTKVRSGAVSGLAVGIRDASGIEYFYGHLDRFARGLRAGQHVRPGQVLGYVGNSGNAAGGPMHVHFEVHVGGLPTTPKPYVDRWLLAAQAKARTLDSKIESKSQGMSIPVHRAITPAAFGGPAVILGAAPASVRSAQNQPEPYGALIAIGGGLGLILVGLGRLRRTSRRRRPGSAPGPNRSVALLEQWCTPEGAVRHGEATDPRGLPMESAPIAETKPRGGPVEEVPDPQRGSVAVGVAVISGVALAVWSIVG